jgi:hypothetical protein
MSPSSSVGSDVFSVLALLSISATVVLLLRYYLPLRTTPAYLLIPVFLALALPSSIVFLVPIDLASSSGTDTDGQRGIWLPDNVMLVAWRLAYWLTFCLTWFVALSSISNLTLTNTSDLGSYFLYLANTVTLDTENQRIASSTPSDLTRATNLLHYPLEPLVPSTSFGKIVMTIPQIKLQPSRPWSWQWPTLTA